MFDENSVFLVSTIKFFAKLGPFDVQKIKHFANFGGSFGTVTFYAKSSALKGTELRDF